MKQKHLHADMIHAWAEGALVEAWDPYQEAWVESKTPTWDVLIQYRVCRGSKPTIDWSHVSESLGYLATDASGYSILTSNKPSIKGNKWISDSHSYALAEHYPSFKTGSCDWRDSLVERPFDKVDDEVE